jgi:hypothetical protein
MNDTNEVLPGTQRGDDEVELTAEDLRALSVGATGESRRPIAASTKAPENVPAQSDSAVRKAISPAGLSVAVVMAVAGVVSGYTYLHGRGAGQSSAVAVTQSTQPQWATPKHQEEPVRFANPFDATEIFEFPADTTEAEAREAVAGFLIDRAMNRQARVESKSTRNR